MKKTYINPSLTIIEVEDTLIIATSGGVADGSGVGNGYNDDDVTYKPGIFGGWDEEE